MATQPTQPVIPTAVQTPTQPHPTNAGTTVSNAKSRKVKKPMPKVDWLFFVAILAVLGQIGLIALFMNSKQAYVSLKQEDADRIYIVQKATTVSQTDIAKLEESFLKEEDIITFLNSLEAARGIFENFDFRFTSDIPQGKDNQYLTFEIIAFGTHENIRQFIGKLLLSSYALEATKIDIMTDTTDVSYGTLTMNGNVYIHLAKK